MRNLSLTQQGIRRHLEDAGDADDALVSKFVCSASDKATQHTLRATDPRGKFDLRSLPELHQS